MRCECYQFFAVIVLSLFSLLPAIPANATDSRIENDTLIVEASERDGTYTIRSKENPHVFIAAAIAAQVNHRWLRAADYPKHEVRSSTFTNARSTGSRLTLTYSGLSAQPDLACTLRLEDKQTFVEIEVQMRNNTGAEVSVQGIRALDASEAGSHFPQQTREVGHRFLWLDGPASADRVLSDSFSEDRPDMKIHDLGEPYEDNLRAVGSQLIYNRQSRQSIFIGALTSEKWLTVLRLKTNDKKDEITGYEVDATGTTELLKENSLKDSPERDRVELSLPVAAGQTLSGERLMISLSSNYHAQLETYGDVIRQMHKPRANAPTPIGWWSWTAYYFGLTEGPALTNAEFLAQHLRDSGYTFFHIDEGYQYARGEYTTPVATKYPHGMRDLERKVQGLGLTPGIWTAPFEVSERSSIFTNHKDWLVHNAQGQPIHTGWVIDDDEGKKLDQLYVLDSTNPGAQQYLRETYATLTKDWGVRYIKLDFMDDSAIEGYYHRPHTTGLEAQRIGLQVIREAVGDDVLLDKDGSVMLNPVGLVDTGRISCDTGHSFQASRDAAPGLAARYYMNRNFYISDPDAFSVSRDSSAAQGDHGGPKTLTLEEAQVGIVLAAVSGGMFEIGDDLPTLYLDADRMKLLQNHDLLDMARLGRAATPIDLMSYEPEDEMPSVFLLRESKRQAILAVFNWTGHERAHQFSLAGLVAGVSAQNIVVDVFSGATVAENAYSVSMNVPSHAVRVLKIIDNSVPVSAPEVRVGLPERIETGKPANFSARVSAEGTPAISYYWDFGDGTRVEGATVSHAYTHAGDFKVHVQVDGVEGVAFEKDYPVTSAGTIDTIFRPEKYQRFVEQQSQK